MFKERQGLCQNRHIFIRNYFNIFSAGGGIIILKKAVEFIQHTGIKAGKECLTGIWSL
jgi:hypothetical protein